jgi:hypothetical protein
MERPNLDEWLEKSGKVLEEEETALEGLKMAIKPIEEVEDFSNRVCPDIAGRDL